MAAHYSSNENHPSKRSHWRFAEIELVSSLFERLSLTGGFVWMAVLAEWLLRQGEVK